MKSNKSKGLNFAHKLTATVKIAYNSTKMCLSALAFETPFQYVRKDFCFFSPSCSLLNLRRLSMVAFVVAKKNF